MTESKEQFVPVQWQPREERQKCAFYINECPLPKPLSDLNTTPEYGNINSDKCSYLKKMQNKFKLHTANSGKESRHKGENEDSTTASHTPDIQTVIDSENSPLSSASPKPPLIQNKGLPVQAFHDALEACKLETAWKLTPTPNGIVVVFNCSEEVNDIFNRIEISKVLKTSIGVATLPQNISNQCPNRVRGSKSNPCMNHKYIFAGGGHNYYKVSETRFPKSQILKRSTMLLIRDVPWSIALEDIRLALEMQGIHINCIVKWRQHVRIEVKNAAHGDYLQMNGLDFYGACKFYVSPERGYPNLKDYVPDDAVQCYRCQGFWHVALNCRQIPRCVRCGDAHGMENCMRARNNPMCCNCYGAHHAAHKECPIRKHVTRSSLIAFTLSKFFPSRSSSTLPPNNTPFLRCLL